MAVGIDIGSKTIKVVELDRDGTKFRLRASGITGHKSLTPEQIKDDKEYALLAESIKKLFREAKISSKNVAIALPETQVYTRTINFPLLNSANLDTATIWVLTPSLS